MIHCYNCSLKFIVAIQSNTNLKAFHEFFPKFIYLIYETYAMCTNYK